MDVSVNVFTERAIHRSDPDRSEGVMAQPSPGPPKEVPIMSIHAPRGATAPLWPLAALLIAIALAAPASAQSTVSLSPDVTIAVGGANLVVQDEDVVVDNQLGIVLLESLGTLSPANDVLGHAVDANGHRLFTLANAASLPGGVFARGGDVVRFDGAAYSIAFDATAEGVPAGARTDAVSLAPGGLLLSFDTTVNLGGTVADDEDLVRWSGGAFSLAFDGSAAGLATGLDVDGAQDLGGGAFLISFDTSGSVGGVVFSDEDVLRFDGAVWSLEVDTSTLDADWVAADVDAVAVPEPALALGAALGGLLLAARARPRR